MSKSSTIEKEKAVFTPFIITIIVLTIIIALLKLTNFMSKHFMIKRYEYVENFESLLEGILLILDSIHMYYLTTEIGELKHEIQNLTE
uniref:Uncharacterized protein n=1 Tax=viral metagenome TaxID=1070528 RepID=A0A6C0CRF9_9ZZZZ